MPALTPESKRFSFLGPSYSGREDAQGIVDRYPVGSRQSAYYDPERPGEAVLHKSVTRIDFFSGYFWVPTVMVVGGLLCMVAGWRGWTRRGVTRLRGR
jgi:hypothetical protein